MSGRTQFQHGGQAGTCVQDAVCPAACEDDVGLGRVPDAKRMLHLHHGVVFDAKAPAELLQRILVHAVDPVDLADEHDLVTAVRRRLHDLVPELFIQPRVRRQYGRTGQQTDEQRHYHEDG